MSNNLPENFVHERPLAVEITADDTCVAARIKALPTSWDDPQITFATTSLTFYSDYGETTKDETIGTAGVITISDDDTFAELQATINASRYWRMTLVAALPDDTVRASSTNNILDITGDSTEAEACASEVGTPLELDTSVVKHASACIGAESLPSTFPFMTRRSDAENWTQIDVDEWEHTGRAVAWSRPRDYAAGIVSIYTANAAITAGTLKVYSVHQDDEDSDDYVLVRSLTGGTDGSSSTDEPNYLNSENGERLVVRYEGSAITTPTMRVQGVLGRIEL